MSRRKTITKKIASLAVATLLAGTACVSLTGCETNRPEAKITLSFNGETYVLQYELYRNLYPQTVRHFIELADAGYYNGTCIHNYTDSILYAGGYTYNKDQTTNGGLVEKDYFGLAPSMKLTPSVFDMATDQSVYTLYGEFSDNGFKVESGAQSQKYGSLVMYYTDKSGDNSRVKTKRSSDGEIDSDKEYKYNSATSLFYVYTGSSSTRNSQYCTFAQLLDTDSSDVLDKLLDAIEDYVDTLEDEEDFLTEVTVRVDTKDPYVSSDKNTATYTVPTMPIVIESVKITKY